MKKHLMWAALVAAGAANAAETLPSVIVSGTRSAQSDVTVPAAITVVTRDEIDDSGAGTLTDLLRGRAGIQVQELYGDGSRSTVSMRGFGDTAAANVLVLVDGRRLNNTDLSGPDLHSVALKDVQQVEVIQGSAGSLFGDQAVGGVINIITRASEQAGFNAEAGAGSDNTRLGRLSASTQGVDGASARASIEARNSDNYRDHNDLRYRNALVRLNLDKEWGRSFVEYQQVREQLELPGALDETQLQEDRRQASPSYPDDETDTITRIGRVGLTGYLGENWQLEAEITSRRSEADGTLFSTPFEQERRHRGLTPRLIGAVPMAGGDALITLGADYSEVSYRYQSAPFGFPAETEDDQITRAVYAQAVVPLSSRLKVTAGARRASAENELTDTSAFPDGETLNDTVSVGELGLSYRLTPDWRVFARRDGNFRFALVDENTFTEPDVTGLDPQTGISWEAGAEWSRNGRRLNVVGYRLNLKNEIAFDAAANGPFGPETGANVNLDPTVRRGVTMEAGLRVAEGLTLGADLSHTDARFDGGPYNGNAIPFVAERSGRIFADYRINNQWQLFVENTYIGERHQSADYANALDTLPAVQLVNASVGYQRERWNARLRVDNVTGKEYVGFATYDAFYPAPERRLLLTLGYGL